MNAKVRFGLLVPSRKAFQDRIIENEIETLVEYIRLKITQEDWHAVSDAANDIRELEALRSSGLIPKNKQRPSLAKQRS